jgi:hypothetical protein
MFQSSTLLSLLFVLVSTAFSSPVQRAPSNNILSLASKINPVQAGKTVAEIDRARVAALLGAKTNGKPVVLTDMTVSYTASVGVGSPATECGFHFFFSLPVTFLGPYELCYQTRC